MRLRVYIETYEQELITALQQLGRKKGKYLQMALAHYYYSKKGKTAFKNMIAESPDHSDDMSKEEKPAIKKEQKRRKVVVNIDNVL